MSYAKIFPQQLNNEYILTNLIQEKMVNHVAVTYRKRGFE